MNNVINFEAVSKKGKSKIVDVEEVKKDNINKLFALVEGGIVSNISLICEMNGKTYCLGEDIREVFDKKELRARVDKIDSYISWAK